MNLTYEYVKKIIKCVIPSTNLCNSLRMHELMYHHQSLSSRYMFGLLDSQIIKPQVRTLVYLIFSGSQVISIAFK